MLSTAPDIRVAFFGDSYTAGVGDPSALGWVGRVIAAARAAGWNPTSYNLGVRRETIGDIQRRFLTEAAPRLRDGDAYGVVVSGGINDTAVASGRRRATVAETLTALDKILDGAAAAHWPVLVVGPPLIADQQRNEHIGELSLVLGKRCADRGVPYVEVAASLVGDEDWMAEVASIDGAHPGASGYARLTELIRPAFLDWLTGLPTGAAAQ
jgi:lysophospholipase L1-like esterase